jgi:hypothetical protein
MRGQMETRFAELEQELEKGRAEFDKFELQRKHLRETMLRISSVIRVLEELLGGKPGKAQGRDNDQDGPSPIVKQG